MVAGLIEALRGRGLIQKAAEAAWRPCDVASLVVFRVCCGVILFWEVTRFFLNGLIDSVYINPPFHFTYLGFGWVRPLPGDGMLWFFLSLGIAAILLTLGFCYRVAAVWLWIGWSYVLLLEKAAYLNHLYLLCLLCFLLIFLPTHRAFSLDARRNPAWRSDFAPVITLWGLRVQLAIPYLLGAFAKLNGDWLHGQPLRMWMARMTHIREVIPFWGEPWVGLAFSWGGFLLDLLVVPALLWRPTRVWAFTAAVSFHLLNALMFHIGIFPWFMICATTIFFDPDWPRRTFRCLLGGSSANRKDERSTLDSALIDPSLPSTDESKEGALNANRRLILLLTGLWFLIQFTVPFRHFLYPGDVDWTEEGQRFSWRMMLCDKTPAMRLFAIDKQTRRVTAIDPRPFLNEWQLNYMGYDPDLLVQFCQHIAVEFRRTRAQDVEVYAQAYCSLNGRRPQLLVDPSIDLAAQTRRITPQPWIVPLREPMPEKPFDEPPHTWTIFFDLPDFTRH